MTRSILSICSLFLGCQRCCRPFTACRRRWAFLHLNSSDLSYVSRPNDLGCNIVFGRLLVNSVHPQTLNVWPYVCNHGSIHMKPAVTTLWPWPLPTDPSRLCLRHGVFQTLHVFKKCWCIQAISFHLSTLHREWFSLQGMWYLGNAQCRFLWFAMSWFKHSLLVRNT